jgi:hypothetical protein
MRKILVVPGLDMGTATLPGGMYVVGSEGPSPTSCNEYECKVGLRSPRPSKNTGQNETLNFFPPLEEVWPWRDGGRTETLRKLE